MLRLVLKLALAGAALWAIWAFVPFGGRTLADRWSAAPSPSAFLDATWAEMKGAPAPDRNPGAKATARARPQRATRPAAPAERHTEADRQAVDRILTQHLDDPARR
jgi:hypothetical protein